VRKKEINLASKLVAGAIPFVAGLEFLGGKVGISLGLLKALGVTVSFTNPLGIGIGLFATYGGALIVKEMLARLTK